MQTWEEHQPNQDAFSFACTSQLHGYRCGRTAIMQDALNNPVCESCAISIVAERMISVGQREVRGLQMHPGLVSLLEAAKWRRRFWWAVAVQAVTLAGAIALVLSK